MSTKTQNLDFWDYPQHTIDGWRQAGDIHGRNFASWTKQLDDGTVLNIQLGKESREYWLRIGDCYYGKHKTPEKAALMAQKEIKKLYGC